MNLNTPNLFVPGAARCGTTTLHSILGQHPDIYAPKFKEPTFFNWPHQVVGNPLAYFRMFSSQKRYRLDATVNYLANPHVPEVLRTLFPDARFIIILRNPKARAYALYRLMRAYESEDLSNFSDALRAEQSRYSSPDFYMMNCVFGDLWNFLYCRSSLYDEQISRYFSVFPREQFHFVSLAELSTDPVKTTESILRFLDLDSEPAKGFTFEIKNRIEENYRPYDTESDHIMTATFKNLTDRTDMLIGRSLDWSL